jgi:hypothetical protein
MAGDSHGRHFLARLECMVLGSFFMLIATAAGGGVLPDATRPRQPSPQRQYVETGLEIDDVAVNAFFQEACHLVAGDIENILHPPVIAHDFGSKA